MIGGENHQRFIPVAVLFYPVGDDFKRGVTTFDSADGVVQIIIVVGPVNISGFHQQPETLFVLAEDSEC